MADALRCRGSSGRGALLALILSALAWTLAPDARAADLAMPGFGSCRGCNLVIVSIDTLRADRLETYGYARPTSPQLREFAAGALTFERAYSTSGVTAESHMSLFTSLYPSVHGVRPVSKAAPRSLAPGIPTLTELLAGQGYATAGFHNGGNVAPEYGFGRGFDAYEHGSFVKPQGWMRMRSWLGGLRDAPYFMFVHTYHVHAPYTPEPGAREAFAPGYEGPIVSDRRALQRLARSECSGEGRCDVARNSHRLYWSRVDLQDEGDLAHVSGLYDAEISELDALFPRVLRAVEKSPRDTILVVLSDHGDAFMEHGFVAHRTLHEEILRVPLIIRHPRAEQTWGRRVAERVSLLDVAPTLLGWLGVEAPDGFQGRPLGSSPARAQPGAPAGATEVLAEFMTREQIALIRGSKKILLYGYVEAEVSPAAKRMHGLAKEMQVPEAQRFHSAQLFDLESDPGETRDLGAEHPDFEPMVRAVLARMIENREHQVSLGTVTAPEAVMDPETLRQLEALGYLD